MSYQINRIRRNKLNQYIPLSKFEKRSIVTSYFQNIKYFRSSNIPLKSFWGTVLHNKISKNISILQKRIRLRNNDF